MIGARDLGVETDTQGLSRLQPDSEYARVDYVGLLSGHDSVVRRRRIDNLNRANEAIGVMVPSSKTQPLRGAEIRVGRIGHGANSEKLEEQALRCRRGIIEFVVNRVAVDAQTVERGVIHK